MKFQSSSEINVKINNHFVKLLYESDVTFSEKKPLPKNTTYTFYNALIEFNSNKRKKINGSGTFNYGRYYNGTKLTLKGNISLRTQPWGIFSLSYAYNAIELPDPYEDAYLTLIGPKIELSFTKSLFFTTFIQYNTQIQNVNINSRLQWRFKPMSDLYIVYTDNYSEILKVKNRAVVVKFIYWLSG